MSTRRTLVIPDLHYPYHDERQFRRVLKFSRDFSPSEIIFLGDIVDLPAVSRYRKPLAVLGHTREDIEGARQDILTPVREAHPRATIKMCTGNHEARIRHYLLDHAPELETFPELTFDSLLGVEKLKIEVTEDYFLLVPKLLATHGSMARKHSGTSAKAHVEKYGISVIIGHVHRLGTYYKTDLSGTVVGIEAGHLVSHDAMKDAGIDYVTCPNWQQGFVILYTDTQTGRFDFQLVWADDAGFRVHGKMYR